VPDIPAHAAAGLGLRTLPFTDPVMRGRIALAWRTDGPASPAARSLLSQLRHVRVTYPSPD
jgi:DNA-binding transcriptional LysR family regulator